jgi:hypothetical protein
MAQTLPPALIKLARTQESALLGTQITAVVGDRNLARLVRAGALTRLWRNAYALPADSASAATRLAAARLTLRRSVTACLHTAAQIFDFDIAGDDRTHILAANDWSSELDGLVQHRCSLIRPMVRIAGQRVTDLAETVVRVACVEADPPKVLAVLDAALHRTSVDRADLELAAADLRIRGIGMVRELIPMADGRAESPGESWMRWVCIEAAFPRPTPQVWVTVRGGRRYRIDLGWEKLRVGCEYEGVEFHTKGALTRDRSKYNAVERSGWLMQGVTSPMIWQDRRILVAEIRSMLDERAG